MKIVCIGDSLALPGHLNTYEDTWFYHLKKIFPADDFISYFRRELTSDVLVSLGGGEAGVDKWPNGADCLEAFLPEVVIIHLGIVDCAPRLLHKVESFFLPRLPQKAASLYITAVKTMRSRSVKRVLVPLERYRSNFERYFERCTKNEVQKVILVQIPHPDKKMVDKNTDIITNVNAYNEILAAFGNKYDFVEVVNPLDSRAHQVEIFEDGYHPNSLGHTLIVNELVVALKKVITGKR